MNVNDFLTKNYDELIQQKHNEIKQLEEEKIREKKEFYKCYGMSCKTCRYSWLRKVYDEHTMCEQDECMLCNDVCDEWKEQNETYEFLKKYSYEDDISFYFEDMFNMKIADAKLEKVKKFVEMYKED